MVENELGLGLVLNGCIYNQRESKADLRHVGYRFFSEGGTEVIIKAYQAWGDECVSRFKGPFAFALWERDTGRVVLARDRLGIKPLYYTEGRAFFRFAPTLPALLACGGVDTSLDPIGLNQFFGFHAAVPPPRIVLRGVTATILTIQPDGTRTSRPYWSFSVGERPIDGPMTEEEWSDALASEVLAAVDRRRVSDVPIGVLLSGGLDSIVSLLAELGHEDIRTFSIGFETVGQHSRDEFRYSDLIARHFWTTHEQIRIGPGRALEVLPDAIESMSEPMVSHEAVAFYLLSAEAEMSPKGHWRLWQAALLEAWLQAHAI